jgi:hypothetical protein
MLSKSILLTFLLTACTGTDGDSGNSDSGDGECEILQDVSCMGEDPTEEIACPEGYQCSGLSAFWCYRGECDNLPECLPGDTRISTSVGEVAISSIPVGMTIWSRNAEGKKLLTTVAKAEHVLAPQHHRVLDLTLADGRHFRASPDHPDTNGKTLVSYKVGEELDGSRITKKALVPFGEDRTWDILPNGPTGDYLANGVWLGSTLKADGGDASASQTTDPGSTARATAE